MSYNGSGTFVVNSSGQPVVTGTVISSTAFNALTADLATGLSTAITKDGQTTTTVRVPFAQGISSTLVTDATSSTTGSIITAGGISTQKALWVGTTSHFVGNTQHDGLVGIGMTPSNVLDITQNQNSSSIANILNNNASGASQAGYWASNGTNSARLGVLGTGYSSTGTFQAGYGLVYASSGLSLCSAGGPILFGANSLSEVARFGTNGSFLVGTTTNGGWSGASSIAAFGTNTNGISSQVAGSTGGNAFLARVENTAVYLSGFYFGASSVGSITTNGTATSYNTSSDYRLKENVQPMTGGLTTVLALKPVTYDWISNGSAGEGFIAHELQAVIPDAVHGEKDAVNEDGSINAQGVDFSKIVPHLVAAIQELTARLTALENK